VDQEADQQTPTDKEYGRCGQSCDRASHNCSPEGRRFAGRLSLALLQNVEQVVQDSLVRPRIGRVTQIPDDPLNISYAFHVPT
jgi:hypothetical protein